MLMHESNSFNGHLTQRADFTLVPGNAPNWRPFFDAQKNEVTGFLDVLTKELKVMDATAISLCKENSIPLIVFDLAQPGNIERAIRGEHIGTIVSNETPSATK